LGYSASIQGDDSLAGRQHPQGIDLDFGELGEIGGQLPQAQEHIAHGGPVGGGQAAVAG